MRRGFWLLAVGVAIAVIAGGCGSARRVTRCPAPPAGERNAYLPKLSSSSGPADSTVTVSARLPLFNEAGKYTCPGTPDIKAYWNLDFDHWPSILRTPGSPAASTAGSPVQDVGNHHVTGGCDLRMQVKIPSVPPGRYPLVFLYWYGSGKGSGGAANGPVSFRVTAR